MTDQLRFGLIGTGWIGRFHAETLAQRLPNTALVAVADPNLEAAQSINAPRAYSDPLALIADADVQAVAISSPATTHADLVIAAAQAGKHVFCEKPMALTLDEADRHPGGSGRRRGAAGGFQPPLRGGLHRRPRRHRRRFDRDAADVAFAHSGSRYLRGRRGEGQTVDDLQRDADP